MIWIVLLVIVLPLFACTVLGQEISSKDLVCYAEDYPPHNYIRNGKLSGASNNALNLESVSSYSSTNWMENVFSSLDIAKFNPCFL
jgi:hypothetical protein